MVLGFERPADALTVLRRRKVTNFDAGPLSESELALTPPDFDPEFVAKLAQLIAWRRDVRRFRRDAVEPDLIERLLDLAQLAPSVGNSQPWRWVSVDSPDTREKIHQNFVACNAKAASGFQGERADLYARLKLEGIDVAPRQFAVFCDRGTAQGAGVGCQTMPETLDYSVVVMIETFWLAARAEGLGVGWVSILDPEQAKADLQVPERWKLIAYLCVGWPVEEHDVPELVRYGWQDRTQAGRLVTSR
ncbi:5,6-dimethylbenzimidazole synthase [Rhodopseudomonas palustris]|uniref:Cob(II)yrinic acid a,c-diamide reductase n=1 Tax=Rhodopseudomonas palustris (strain BisB18) TaxID=316056 RepID=Q210A2_RHOPB